MKFVCYLEPLTADTGALRLLPGSHHPGVTAALTGWVRRHRIHDEKTLRAQVAGLPLAVVETEPGDVVVFDWHTWHASLGGVDRLQWTVSYVKDPASPAEVERFKDVVIDTGIKLDRDPDYDARAYPHYDEHPLWRAAATGAVRGQGPVVWASGGRMNLWLDAVADRGLVHAVFSETRYWGGKGLSLLDAAPTAARPIPISGTCRHCGADTWGYTACPACDDVQCRSCGRCGCGAPRPATRICTACNLEKGKAQFPTATSRVCRDCG